jgi:hypothetical protein
LVMDAGDTGATVIFSFFKAAANDGKRRTVVLRPTTVDPDCAGYVAPDVEVQLEDVIPKAVLPEELLPEGVLPLAVVLLLEPPLHAAARSATAAIAPSAGSRRKLNTTLLDAALVFMKRIPTPSWPAAMVPTPSGSVRISARRARQRHRPAYPTSGAVTGSRRLDWWRAVHLSPAIGHRRGGSVGALPRRFQITIYRYAWLSLIVLVDPPTPVVEKVYR